MQSGGKLMVFGDEAKPYDILVCRKELYEYSAAQKLEVKTSNFYSLHKSEEFSLPLFPLLLTTWSDMRPKGYRDPFFHSF